MKGMTICADFQNFSWVVMIVVDFIIIDVATMANAVGGGGLSI